MTFGDVLDPVLACGDGEMVVVIVPLTPPISSFPSGYRSRLLIRVVVMDIMLCEWPRLVTCARRPEEPSSKGELAPPPTLTPESATRGRFAPC